MVNKDVAENTISFAVQTTKITSEMLQEILSNYLTEKMPHGKISYGKLSERGKLESIEVTENNIGDFLSTARKYDIDYALKRDSSTAPPTYHVFFSSGNSENFRKAFAEYAGKMNEKLSDKSISKVVNREQIKQNAQAINQKSAAIAKEKHLSKSEIAGR